MIQRIKQAVTTDPGNSILIAFIGLSAYTAYMTSTRPVMSEIALGAVVVVGIGYLFKDFVDTGQKYLDMGLIAAIAAVALFATLNFFKFTNFDFSPEFMIKPVLQLSLTSVAIYFIKLRW